MKHFAPARFWAQYNALPREVRALADKNYALLKSDSRHPSLHFKRIGKLWSVRVGEHYRALGIDVSIRLRLLVVCHCYRESERIIRIISARKADPTERRDYARWLP